MASTWPSLRSRGRRIETIGFQTSPYPARMRERLLACTESGGRACHLAAEFRAWANCTRRRRCALSPSFGPVELIGCHGQTIYHEGGRHTLQIGEAAVIAERTGVPVVSDFRARDIAAGGQGRAAGSLCRLSALSPCHAHAHRAQHRRHRQHHGDSAARSAGTGDRVRYRARETWSSMRWQRSFHRANCAATAAARSPHPGSQSVRLLDSLLKDRYYRRRPPKSAGREQYGAEFVERMKRSNLSLRDLIATATALTARAIALAVREHQTRTTDLIVSGGGVHNPQIMAQLAGYLPSVDISTSADHGVDADAKEAIAFRCSGACYLASSSIKFTVSHWRPPRRDPGEHHPVRHVRSERRASHARQAGGLSYVTHLASYMAGVSIFS